MRRSPPLAAQEVLLLSAASPFLSAAIFFCRRQGATNEEADDKENPSSIPLASNSRLSPLPSKPTGFYNDYGTIVDIPLDTSNALK
ncbi:hypothetical protein ZIOFF_021480 [Zingiber officinale]|uniref:Uncharacterized protein n=1 Tax=Zingiber officinale TaxID=94328 RepID=A0A8J5H3X2_ZINOF|nr:hypothetical protein ZIOFF_021480 [Zingiber officinale]